MIARRLGTSSARHCKRDRICRLLVKHQTGLQAVQSAEELQPDVIFLDIGMPKLNGIEAAPPNIATCSRRKNPLYQSREQRRGNRGSSKGWSKGITVKTDVGLELLPALESILRGKQFTSRGAAQPRYKPA